MTSPSAEAQRLRELARLRRVRDRIDREYAQPLDVEALARGAHMSAGHFSREFRRAYGESPYAWALLRRGELSVTAVCCSSFGTFSTRIHRPGRRPLAPTGATRRAPWRRRRRAW